MATPRIGTSSNPLSDAPRPRGGKRQRGSWDPSEDCTSPGCLNKIQKRGGAVFCQKHYEENRVNVPKCEVEDCENNAYCKNLCGPHYYRRMRKGTTDGLRQHSTYGEGYINNNGYRIVNRIGHPNAMAGGGIAEHRLVMAEKIGRPLLENETPHHINGDRLDNRPENLELWVKQPPGQRATDLLAYARAIIARYEPIEDKLGGSEPESRYPGE